MLRTWGRGLLLAAVFVAMAATLSIFPSGRRPTSSRTAAPVLTNTPRPAGAEPTSSAREGVYPTRGEELERAAEADAVSHRRRTLEEVARLIGAWDRAPRKTISTWHARTPRNEADGEDHEIPRELPEPRGPEGRESVREYVVRLVRDIRELDGKEDQYDALGALQLELEAYADKDPAAVESLVSAVREERDRRTREIGLILLGRVRSRAAEDFLLEVAGGRDPQWREVPPAAESRRFDGAVLGFPNPSLSEIAAHSLLQAAGKVGPHEPFNVGDARVAPAMSTLEDPYVFDRLLNLLADPAAPGDARLSVLRGMAGNLPDGELGGMGDYPRPKDVAAQAERALQLLIGLAGNGGDPQIEDEARVALTYVKRPDVAVQLVDIALAEKTPVRRSFALGEAARAIDVPVVREKILQEFTGNPDPEVRETIVQQLKAEVLSSDSAFRAAVLRAISGDASFAVRTAALGAAVRSRDEDIIGAALQSIETADLRDLPEGYRENVRRTTVQIRNTAGMSESLRTITERVGRRMGQ